MDRHVFAFSSARDLPEQLASTRSVLAHVGTPNAITIISDGSHSARDRHALEGIHSSISVVHWERFAATDLPRALRRYAEVNPMGKKLAALCALPGGPTMYADSDVLFFPGARAGPARSIFASSDPWYLPDLPGGLAEGITAGTDRPANAGFFLTSQPMDLDELVHRLPLEPVASDVYVEQSLVHEALHRISARPLPRDLFVLHTDDHFAYRDWTDIDMAAARHYIGMVRYRFWLAVGRTSTAF